jgi:phosphoribosylaminoimidazolecarboxamide formyltransferase/IMP cyclohydrolase
MEKITRAILSVTDKTGIAEFAGELSKMNVEIISTGGTAKTIRESGITVKDISEVTGFPEMMDGRVKTLHPKVHGGLLALRDNPKHAQDMQNHGIEPISLVAVNLYAFEKTIAKQGVTIEEAIENIDIGGPSMLRSAAKNYKFVTVVVDPADYLLVISQMKENNGVTTLNFRFEMAKKVFRLTFQYDMAISKYLDNITL